MVRHTFVACAMRVSRSRFAGGVVNTAIASGLPAEGRGALWST